MTYICVARDPRDVFLSWDNHLANMDVVALFTARQNAVGLDDIMDQLGQGPPERAEREIDRFWEWVDDATVVAEAISLESTLHHWATFWDVRDRPNVVMLHYDDLAADLEGEMRRLAARLGIAVGDALWPTLVKAASFDDMRSGADAVAPESSSAIWHDNRRFFNQGTSGQWRRLLDDDDVARYVTRVRQLAAPDLVAWVHRDLD